MSDPESNVVRLLDRAPVSVDDPADLADWAHAWIDAIAGGEYGSPKSMLIVIERDDGRLGVISQSMGAMDKARICGLLHLAAQWKGDGDAQIEDLKP